MKRCVTRANLITFPYRLVPEYRLPLKPLKSTPLQLYLSLWESLCTSCYSYVLHGALYRYYKHVICSCGYGTLINVVWPIRWENSTALCFLQYVHYSSIALGIAKPFFFFFFFALFLKWKHTHLASNLACTCLTCRSLWMTRILPN